MTDLVVFGSGGMGREILGILRALSDVGRSWRFRGFVADWAEDLDAVGRLGERFLGTPEVAAAGDLLDGSVGYIVGVGEGAARRRIDARLTAIGWSAHTVVHPSATVGPDVVLGDGSVLCAGAHVTTGVRMGRGTIINVGATVSHDAVLGEFVTLSPHASVLGRARIGDMSTIHTSAVVAPRVTVGVGCIVGAGSVALEEVRDGQVVVGTPARQIARE